MSALGDRDLLAELHEEQCAHGSTLRVLDRYRELLEQVDAHYSGSLDHRPAYVARIREALPAEAGKR